MNTDKIRYTVLKVIVKGDTVLTKGMIVINDTGFDVVSGGWGKGTIPHGVYKLGNYVELKDEPGNNSYKNEGFPWYIKLIPMFKTQRTGLMIHPDGGVEGTNGCIGITNDDMEFNELIREVISRKQEIYLEVV